MPTFYMEVFGCQMNQLDGEVLASLFEERGFEEAAEAKAADVVVFLGCSVRQHAEDRLLSRAGQLKWAKKKNPNMVVAVAGCIAQYRREEILKRLPFVDIVAGPGALTQLVDTAATLLNGGRRPWTCYQHMEGDFDTHRRPKSGAVSAFVRVMRGCSRACAYCVVPRARGPATSRHPDSILKEVHKIASAGCKEVILIGQDVSAYKHEDVDLPRLLQMVAEIDGLARIGFVTSHPLSVTPRLFEVIVENPRISRYLHMPAQSGSDRILKLMRRGYTAHHYSQIVHLARSICPDIEVASDFIVGFPTETEEDFSKTVVIRRCGFINSYIFKYSPRPHTAAAKMADDVPLHIKKQRNLRLLQVQQEVSLERKRLLIGRTVTVLVEGHDKKSDRPRGRTWNNHIVVFNGNATKGQVVRVKIEKVTALTAFGRMEEEG